MEKRVENEPLIWMEESKDKDELYTPVKSKRKLKFRKTEFVGWGSKSLIEFLQSIGVDTSENLSQYDVTAIINRYVNENSLFQPKRKKRIVCDDKLHSLFGRKTVSRFKIHDLLESHFLDNQEEMDSGDDLFYSSDEEEESVSAARKQPNVQRKKVVDTPKSCFAAVVPENVKAVYLRRSLVENLLKKPEEFEDKVVGSIVRIKCDPNDYLQKNSHQIVLVTGMTKVSGTDGSPEILLQVSNSVKDIRICMLSDDKFTEEECKDLQQKVKDGLLEKFTVVELKKKAQILHEDVTKHWIVRELDLLQNLIDRANEKGWRRELFEYLERRQLLQSEAEQARLLLEVPDIIAEEIELEAKPDKLSINAKRGNDEVEKNTEIPISGLAANQLVSAQISTGVDAAVAGNQLDVSLENHEKQAMNMGDKSNGEAQVVHPNEIEGNQRRGIHEVIELTDDEKEVEDGHLGSLIWYYLDPQGEEQGPFSTASLKRWGDAEYFPPDFKVWKEGESQDNAVLLTEMLRQVYAV